ncbi:MAG: hypothetical protein ACRD3J_07555 [Thermoanaerobaculia bacterium]
MRIALAVAIPAILLAGNKPAEHVNAVTIVATEYAFQAPQELAPGPTSFRFQNNGKVFHEFNIFLLKPGVTLDYFVSTRGGGIPAASLMERHVGVLFSAPGKTSSSELTTRLLPGRTYAIICNLTDNPKAKPHFTLGMYKGIHVRGVAAPARNTSTPPVMRATFFTDTIIGSDYSFKYPTTITPGHHTFLFRNAGTVRHEVNMVLLKKGATVAQIVELAKNGGDPFSLVEDDTPGVLLAQPGESPNGQIDNNFLPGRDYGILCTFQNDDKSPPHFALGMSGTIHVAEK